MWLGFNPLDYVLTCCSCLHLLHGNEVSFVLRHNLNFEVFHEYCDTASDRLLFLSFLEKSFVKYFILNFFLFARKCSKRKCAKKIMEQFEVLFSRIQFEMPILLKDTSWCPPEHFFRFFHSLTGVYILDHWLVLSGHLKLSSFLYGPLNHSNGPLNSLKRFLMVKQLTFGSSIDPKDPLHEPLVGLWTIGWEPMHWLPVIRFMCL